MVKKPDIEQMVITLDNYCAELADEKTRLEQEKKEEEKKDEPDTDGIDDEIEVLSDWISRIEAAIEAIEEI